MVGFNLKACSPGPRPTSSHGAHRTFFSYCLHLASVAYGRCYLTGKVKISFVLLSVLGQSMQHLYSASSLPPSLTIRTEAHTMACLFSSTFVVPQIFSTY